MAADPPLEEWQEFLLKAERRFHQLLLAARPEHPGFASRAILDISRRVTQVSPNEIESMTWTEGGVAGEIQETFNLVNRWGATLFRLQVWIEVYREYERELESSEGDIHDRLWELRDHAIDPLAYYCMLQPSASKWRLAVVAEHALHVGNRAVVPGYRDALAQDDLGAGRWRRLKEIISQVDRLAENGQWQTYRAFRDRLGQLDSRAYASASGNFRNLAAHGFAPRFEVGIVTTMRREVVPWAELKPQADGTWERVEDPGQKGVRYGFGGMYPLSYADAYDANRQQYLAAREALSTLQNLIDEITTAMNGRSSETS